VTSTPLEPAPALLGGGRPLFLKREDVHGLGAFKWRGALPVVTAYREAGAEAVVTASTGNHGAATAWAAERLGMHAVVYVPEDAAEAKLALVRNLGAEVRLAGADMDEAKEEARGHAERTGLPLFEDGAEPAQYEGYGAIADEILDQLAGPPGAVVVPVGNGALFGGIGMRLVERAP
jgi:threonine dehydratase